jgi:hypothetical protein
MNEEEYIEKIKRTKQVIKKELVNVSFEEKIWRVENGNTIVNRITKMDID